MSVSTDAQGHERPPVDGSNCDDSFHRPRPGPFIAISTLTTAVIDFQSLSLHGHSNTLESWMGCRRRPITVWPFTQFHFTVDMNPKVSWYEWIGEFDEKMVTCLRVLHIRYCN